MTDDNESGSALIAKAIMALANMKTPQYVNKFSDLAVDHAINEIFASATQVQADPEIDYFKDVVFIIGCSSAEKRLLQDKWESTTSWYNLFDAFYHTVGKLNGHSVEVRISYVELNQRKIAFVCPSGNFIDKAMIEKWIQNKTGHTIRWDNKRLWAYTHALNFYHCIRAVQLLNEPDQVTVSA